MNKFSYLIYYPATNIGGAQLLMARAAEYLIKNGGSISLLINSKIGTNFIYDYLNRRELKFDVILFNENSRYVGSKDEILILPQPTIFKLNEVLDPRSKNKIFQWDTHPTGVISHLSFSKYTLELKKPLRWVFKCLDFKKYKILKKYLEESHAKGSIYFMCGKNYYLNKEIFNIDFEPNYLPIPISIGDKLSKKFDSTSNIINVAWIGRLDSVKHRLVEFVIKDISQLNYEYKNQIKFHVIGDGDYKSELVKKYKFPWLSFEGSMSNNKVTEYYNDNNIHIGINVGTSALEAGMNWLYSILLPGLIDIDYYSNKDNRYLELFNSNNYDVSLSKERIHEAESLEMIFKKIDESGIEHLSKRSMEYVNDNHSDESVFQKFINSVNHTELTYTDIVDMEIFHTTLIQKVKKIIHS